MNNLELQTDLLNLRGDLEWDGVAVIDEVLNYAAFLEGQEALLLRVIDALNEVEDNPIYLTKDQILGRLKIAFA